MAKKRRRRTEDLPLRNDQSLAPYVPVTRCAPRVIKRNGLPPIYEIELKQYTVDVHASPVFTVVVLRNKLGDVHCGVSKRCITSKCRDDYTLETGLTIAAVRAVEAFCDSVKRRVNTSYAPPAIDSAS